MPAQEPVIFSTYGALDSDCIADGRPSDAHVLRTLAGSANRLITRSQPLAACIYSAVPESVLGSAFPGLGFEYPGLHKGPATPSWLKLTCDLPVVKKPLIRRAKVFVRMGASDDSTLALQVATEAAPYRSTARAETSGNVYAFTGSATDPYGPLAFVIEDVPLREGVTETVSVYIRSRGLGADGDGVTYGGNNDAEIARISDDGMTIKASDSGTWNDYTDPDNWAVGGHAVSVVNALGNAILDARWITKVLSGDELRVWPPIPQEQREDLIGATFTIQKLPVWRLYGLTVYGEV